MPVSFLWWRTWGAFVCILQGERICVLCWNECYAAEELRCKQPTGCNKFRLLILMPILMQEVGSNIGALYQSLYIHSKMLLTMGEFVTFYLLLIYTMFINKMKLYMYSIWHNYVNILLFFYYWLLVSTWQDHHQANIYKKNLKTLVHIVQKWDPIKLCVFCIICTGILNFFGKNWPDDCPWGRK